MKQIVAIVVFIGVLVGVALYVKGRQSPDAAAVATGASAVAPPGSQADAIPPGASVGDVPQVLGTTTTGRVSAREELTPKELEVLWSHTVPHMEIEQSEIEQNVGAIRDLQLLTPEVQAAVDERLKNVQFVEAYRKRLASHLTRTEMAELFEVENNSAMVEFNEKVRHGATPEGMDELNTYVLQFNPETLKTERLAAIELLNMRSFMGGIKATRIESFAKLYRNLGQRQGQGISGQRLKGDMVAVVAYLMEGKSDVEISALADLFSHPSKQKELEFRATLLRENIAALTK